MSARVLSIGDIGVLDGMIHIGDEAMFESLVDAMRERDVEVVAMSAAPDDTASRYGVDAIARIGFDLRLGRTAAAERMHRVIAAVTDRGLLAPDDPALAVIESVRLADGVVIAGGGNLASTWPLHIYERATLAGIASAAERPLVITGQTLGPELDAVDRGLVAGLLHTAGLVGVRESASLRLAQDLGADGTQLLQNPDDASFLTSDSAPPTAPYLLVSLSTHLGGVERSTAVAAIGRLIDQIAEQTSLEVRFHAHFGALDRAATRGDSVLHGEVRASMRSPSTIEPTTDARSAAALARGAAFVMTSRYHPAVFAASGAVPILAIPVDDYTGVKLRGALQVAGQDGVYDMHRLVNGSGLAAFESLWADRDAIRERGLTRVAEAQRAATSWWDRVARAFDSGSTPSARPRGYPVSPAA